MSTNSRGVEETDYVSQLATYFTEDPLFARLEQQPERFEVGRLIDSIVLIGHEERYKIAGRPWRPYVVALRQTAAEYILFFFQELYPYLKSPTTKNRTCEMESLLSTITSGYVRIQYTCVWLYTISEVDASTHERWEAGLMRIEQVGLIKQIIKAAMDEARAIIRLGGGVEELTEAGWSTRHLLAFVTSNRFRSERLEILLLRCLGHDDINWKVVDGVRRATRMHDISVINEKLQHRNGFQIDIYGNSIRYSHWRYLYPSTTWSVDSEDGYGSD
ncbi:hypothetical protein BJ508DRAFT_418129 [Ascobolus immersus RN42]|uniref:Uncharacterized protein n=1 Tax=Ascobolus immersus RN42 TaxID=1160509 RepID=A0A3N4I0Q9_ASCIM|nr:hypothetical protein BJ508DRAFT_418129 [Ascobolus immersus RN42]